MGKIVAGILGGVSGKVAGVIGGRWKNVNYLRGYAIPANPNTDAQQVQRLKLSDCVAFCKALTGPIFNEYYDKFIPGMSGFNAFIKANIATFDEDPDYTAIVLGTGKLWTPGITAATIVSSDCNITFPTTLGNNGLATDKAFACIIDTMTNLWNFAAAPVNRSTGTITVHLTNFTNAAASKAFLLFAQYNNGILSLVSNSSFKQPSL